ncbi:Phage tail sheath protein [compost metagenome]
MVYKSPGAYARFVKTATAVSSAGATRVMAIVGTGTMFYNAANEGISRSAKQSSDALANGNVFEVHSVTSKPLYQGLVVSGSVEYQAGIDYDLIGGKYIAWKTKEDEDSQPGTGIVAGSSTGSSKFLNYVTALVDGNNGYLVQDGNYRVEITYVDSALGAYRVIDESTQEVLGEYGISATAVDVIPGIKLTVSETFVPKMTGTPPTAVLDADGNPISDTTVGDYVIVSTRAGKAVDTAPAAGSAYYVSYTFKKPEEQFVPKVFYTYDDVVAEYGNYDVTASGKIINSIALGAEIAFLNGTVPIVCIQAKSDSDYEMKQAIDKLTRPVLGIENINTVVPLSTSKSIGSHAANHASDMSLPTNGKERMTYLAAEVGESVGVSSSTAKSLANERVIYVVPGSVTKDIKDLRTGKSNLRTLPGCYLAVAVASLGLKNDPAEPLTNKSINGFKDLNQLYTESEMNLMAESGCLVMRQTGSVIKVRHGVTTSTVDINSQEITLVQIRDYVIAAARQSLGESYVGNKLRPTIISDIQSALISLLNQFKGQEVILNYGGINVKRSTEDPRQVDVKFEIEAVYPLNFIDISFSFSGVS